MTSKDIRNEGMRIGGKIVHADEVVEVRYPYTDEVIGTVPAGKALPAGTVPITSSV